MENDINLFTSRPPFELNDNEELRMAQFEKNVTQIVGMRTSPQDISRILQQKVLMERENLEKFSLGILNILLNTDNAAKFQQFFQALQFLTQDGFEFIILKLESVIIAHIDLSKEFKIVYVKFQALKIESALNLLKILHNFIKLRLPRVDTLLMLCLRQVVIEDFSEKMQQYTRMLLSILNEESDWLIANFKDIALIFAKLLRMLSFVLSAEMTYYKNIILKLLSNIWNTRKDDCINLGRELIRLMMENFKAKELEFITMELKTPYKNSEVLYEYLLKNKGETLPLQEIVKVLLPPYLEELLSYLHLHTPVVNMPRLMRWITKDFKIQATIINEFILADIARFLVVCMHPPLELMYQGITPRYQTLIYMLKISKNSLAKALIKQNIFYDWMFYNSKKDSIMLIEPGINLIKETFMSDLALCHELLDYLFISSKEFNPKSFVETKAAIRSAFGDSLKMGIAQTFDDLINSEALDFSIREKMSSFIPSEKTFQNKPEPLEAKPVESNHAVENSFKPNNMDEEYNPFDEFIPYKFDESLLGKHGEMHEYDPDSAVPDLLGYEDFGNGMDEEYKDQGKTQSFEERFKDLITKMKESPDKSNFEAFLKEFIHYTQSGHSDEDKYYKFADTLSNYYEDHFEDIMFTIENNIIKILLQHALEALHTVISTYNLLKNILRGLYKARSTISFQYLVYYYKIMTNPEKVFLEDYILLIGGERSFEPQLSEDINRLYSVFTQTEFNELVIKIMKDFCNYIIGRAPIIRNIIEIGDSSLNFMLEEELTCSTLKLFSDKVKDLVINSTAWSLNSQEALWSLMTNQFNLSQRKEAPDFLTNIRDVLNESCRDPTFNKHTFYGFIKGFRRFFNDVLQNKDDKTKLDYLVLMIDLHHNFSFFLHSLFNLVDPHLVKVSLKEYVKRNGEEFEKIRNLGHHMIYMKTKRYNLKNEESVMENHLKSILTRAFQKHKLEKDFKEIIED